MSTKQQRETVLAAGDEIDRTVKLASAALDHPDLSDEELDALCDAALSEECGAGKPVRSARKQ